MNLNWNTVEKTVGEFVDMTTNPTSKVRIDCDPIGQRPDIESMCKRQGILDTVFRGYDFGELKLRTLVEAVRQATGFKYRSIDGGHRKRAIRDFISGKFKLGKNTVCFANGQLYDIGGLYYKELPEDVRDFLSNYKMRFTVYSESMTDEQAGETFRRTNITTDVNHQEMLNSYEDNLVAKFVREISRPIRGLNNEYHDLFEYKSFDVEDRKQCWFQKPSKRLRDDEFVTRFLTILTKDAKATNWLTSTNREMEKTFIDLDAEWRKDEQLAKRHQKMVIDALDFMLKYTGAKKEKSKITLSTQEFTLVARFYCYMVKTFGRAGFKVNDYQELYIAIRGAMDRFVGRDESNLRNDLHKDSKGRRTVTECFKQYLTVHDDQERCANSVKWLLEEMDIENCGITFKDTKRVFAPEVIEQVLRKQGYKCWVTGLPLDIKDAVGGHIISHAEGGKTDISNCMVCHKTENTRMGAMDAHMYRASRLRELNNVKEEAFDL